MNSKEAIKIITTRRCYECAWGCESPYTCTAEGCGVKEAVELAIVALERMRPKEVLVSSVYDTQYSHRCPTCNEKLDSFNLVFMQDGEQLACFGGKNCCDNCGQRLEWRVKPK